MRILPAYYAVLMLYVLLGDLREGGALQPLWKFVSFSVNLTPAWGEQLAYSHAWSLCVEEHFYLLFPLLYMPTYARLDGLLLGVTLAMVRAFRPLWWQRLHDHSSALLCGALVMFYLCAQLPLMSLAGATLLYPLVALGCAALLLSVTSPASFLSRLRVPGAQMLAVLAFSLYLTHRQIYHTLDTLLPQLAQQNTVLAAAGYGTASLLAAALLYWLIERPALGLRRRLLSTTQRAAADSTAVRS